MTDKAIEIQDRLISLMKPSSEGLGIAGSFLLEDQTEYINIVGGSPYTALRAVLVAERTLRGGLERQRESDYAMAVIRVFPTGVLRALRGAPIEDVQDYFIEKAKSPTKRAPAKFSIQPDFDRSNSPSISKQLQQRLNRILEDIQLLFKEVQLTGVFAYYAPDGDRAGCIGGPDLFLRVGSVLSVFQSFGRNMLSSPEAKTLLEPAVPELVRGVWKGKALPNNTEDFIKLCRSAMMRKPQGKR